VSNLKKDKGLDDLLFYVLMFLITLSFLALIGYIVYGLFIV